MKQALVRLTNEKAQMQRHQARRLFTFAPYTSWTNDRILFTIMSSAMTISMSSAHSSTFPTLHLHHSSFSNPSIASLGLHCFVLFHCHNLKNFLSNGNFIFPVLVIFSSHNTIKRIARIWFSWF